MSRRTHGWLALAATLLVSLPGAAKEDAATLEAREHLGKAKIHFKLREFERAVAEYREAYRLKPIPALLFNIAQGERMLRNYREAKFYYETYLHDLPDAPNRAEVLTQLAELTALIKEEPAKVAAPEPVAAPPPIVAPVAAKIVAPIAEPEPASAEPPLPVRTPEPVAARAPTPAVVPRPPQTDSPPVVVRVPLAERLAPSPVPATPGPPIIARVPQDWEVVGPTVVPEPPRQRAAWPWVLVAAGATAAGAGGYFGWNAGQVRSEANAARFQDDAARLARDAQSQAGMANALYGVGGVVLAIGVGTAFAW